MKLEPGARLGGGRFTLIRPIGSGGMASVWAARHELLDREVALKMVRTERAGTGPRFVREARIGGRFRHPNIVSVLDAGELPEEGFVFLVMELLAGETLAERLVPGARLTERTIVPILVSVCRGLSVAHAAGVVHRDVKPENVFLAQGEAGRSVPKVLDFGISCATSRTRADRLTLDGQLVGTPAYMSPEQAIGAADVDPRADVWAVGVILYEALSGRLPFDAANPCVQLRCIVDEEPAPLPADVSAPLRAIVSRCLQKDREHRFADASKLGAELEQALTASRRRTTRTAARASELRRAKPGGASAATSKRGGPARLMAGAGAVLLLAALLTGPTQAEPRSARAGIGAATPATDETPPPSPAEPAVLVGPAVVLDEAEPPPLAAPRKEPPLRAPTSSGRLTRVTRPGF